MPTDDELLEDARTALQTALRTGKSVTFNGRTFQPHDLSALRDIIASLSGATGSTASRLAAFSKGA